MYPLIDIDEPNFSWWHIDNVAPQRQGPKPHSDSEAPMREQLRRDSVLPNALQSSTDSDEPKRRLPKIAREAPKRAKLLRDTAAPKSAMSKTEIDEPKRLDPKRDSAEPRLATLRSAKADPRLE
mmetsp:Transcript_67240/g.136920  ORF Transcript_67240/g.136920 Transcript_67240/m.136920 type:complete len:124 (+) Transcript_67240:348-719(+)